jgi:hypothetical protein
LYCLSPQKHPTQGRERAGRTGEEEEEEAAREKKVVCAGLDRGNLSKQKLFFLKSKKKSTGGNVQIPNKK